jgi:hypothetical protein
MFVVVVPARAAAALPTARRAEDLLLPTAGLVVVVVPDMYRGPRRTNHPAQPQHGPAAAVAVGESTPAPWVTSSRSFWSATAASLQDDDAKRSSPPSVRGGGDQATRKTTAEPRNNKQYTHAVCTVRRKKATVVFAEQRTSVGQGRRRHLPTTQYVGHQRSSCTWRVHVRNAHGRQRYRPAGERLVVMAKGRRGEVSRCPRP